MGHKTNKSPYESHDREVRCALCKETKDEKAVKVFTYWDKDGYEVGFNVCGKCEDKKRELKDLAKKYLSKS